MTQSLHNCLPGGSLHDDLTTRLAYARDASMYRILPKAVLRPKNEVEVQNLLLYAKENRESITFRTGGTSLSGQSITSGLLAEVLYNWQKVRILDNGNKIWCEPGVNGAVANRLLSGFGRKIGPDPASINVARIGGIVSNNSSGMMCGTQFNAYHTLDSISFILTNGHAYNSSNTSDQNRFVENEPALAKGLIALKKEIESSSKHQSRIRNKYRIKNTIGYSLNAFLDYDSPLDIFSHLLVGAEGTLAFISNVTLNTIPNPHYKGTGLLLFKTPESAGESVQFFKDLGAAAIEFMDDESLKTAQHVNKPPYDAKLIQKNMTGLLIEFEDNSETEIQQKIQEATHFSSTSDDVTNFQLVTDAHDRDTIWKIRKGLYPTLGSLRKAGTSVITEDIAVDVENLAQAIRELKSVFQTNQFHDGVIFGHARDGNLHFITSVDLDTHEGMKRYEGLMNDLSIMTLDKFNGSLKAEHGTGRNMASFVEAEWGGELYEIMWKVKELADPNLTLNPDVLLSRDQTIHMTDLKSMPKVDEAIDQCIECGFCERICPSRGLTFTPRQRIAIMREMKVNPIPEIERELHQYMFDETCATDGLCQVECPVNINTGEFVKSQRVQKNEKYILSDWSSNHFNLSLQLIKTGLKIANISKEILGRTLMNTVITSLVKPFIKTKEFAFPKTKIHIAKPIEPSIVLDYHYLLFPTCVGRVIAGDSSKKSATYYLREIAFHANVPVKLLERFDPYCCGMAYESRGHKDIAEKMQFDLLTAIKNENQINELPVVIDMSPCNEFLIQSNSGIPFMDSVEFLTRISPKLKFDPIPTSVYAHPVCSLQKAGKSQEFFDLVQKCVTDVELPSESFCCGTGGDRLLKAPGLPKNAVEQSQFSPKAKKGVSSSRTCEIGLAENLGIEFSSIESLVYHAIKK